MKSLFHKKNTESHPVQTQAQGDYVLEGISGEAVGQVYIIGSEPTSIHDRFSIEKKGEYILAKSLTESELYISGEFIHESILEPGDIIVTLNSEYRFRFKPANEEIVERRKQMVVRLALVALILFIALPVLTPKYAPWPPLFNRTEVIQAIKQASQAFEPGSPVSDLAFGENPATTSTDKTPAPATKKITDPAAVSQIIATARMRYEIAQAYAQEGNLFAGHLFWAIEELKDVSHDLSQVDPQPDILPTVNQELARYKKVLDNHLRHLHVRALIAQRLGDNDQYTKLVKEIQYVSQYQGNAAFEWAAKVLQDGKK